MRIPVKPVIIKKTGDVENALKKYLDQTRTLSPSAINEFLNCPVRFYFNHIAGLPQTEEVTEEIDPRMFGNLLHNTLKLIYEPFKHFTVTPEKLEAVLKDESIINCAVDKAFDEILYDAKDNLNTRKPEGFNIIVRQVIYSYARQFLKAELNSCPFTIEELEERHIVLFPVSLDSETVNLKIGVIIDRIDRQGGRIRILDYKTGGIKDRFNTVESLFEAGEKLRNDAVFQVFLYSLVYQKMHPDERILPGLFFLRQSYEADFSPFIQFGPKKEPLTDFSIVKPEFENRLRFALETLFDKKIPFTQTNNLKVCEYCPYAMICRKETRE
jgi:ATP-dependent helicase/DNAse subunit B